MFGPTKRLEIPVNACQGCICRRQHDGAQADILGGVSRSMSKNWLANCDGNVRMNIEDPTDSGMLDVVAFDSDAGVGRLRKR